MSRDDASDLFEIKLSEDGIKYIRKFARLVKFVVILGILISIASISSGIYYILGNTVDYSALDYSKRLYFKLFPFFSMFAFLIISCAIIFLLEI